MIDGQKRKVVMQMNRNGFLYVIDRTNGQLLSAKPFGKVNWATHVDMATGRPVESELSKKLRAGEEIEMWPSIRGAKNWPHAAFNPNTGLLYANTNHQGSFYKFTELAPYKPGLRYQGMANRYPELKPGDVVGHIEAIDPLTAKAKWRVPLPDYQIWSAMLATGGGLLFTGKSHRGILRHGRGHRRDAVGVPDELGRQRDADHLDAQGQAVRDGAVRPRRLYGTSGRARLSFVPLGGSVWTFALQD